ncbi:DUF3530 family protein [Marinomonas sp. M1K-6]|uniref:DUF3530 family protein n=1 Tax=Marinomonas profundi TaxID=2726122 RepID=A0A847QY02_9GAMM|nr:DUF3530 family protein [Marinomonas profundi]NLQ17599.1 DUF3530 family protein [Marinomonas profundi]UDV02184.1 alpha/beta hydrolase family protein [Marinomonas profundi]
MKKFTALPHVIMALLVLSANPTLWAEEPQVTPNNNTAPAQPTRPEDAKEYLIPKPQESRIEALTTSLAIRRLDHEILTLEADGEPFLTLYKPSMTSSTQGCVILLAGDNEHPDWPDAIAPLRNDLPQYSWCTLSVEVPDIIKRGQPVSTASIEENNQTNAELPNQAMVFARIQAAMSHAQSNDVEQFVLLGDNTGASYALGFVVANPTAGTALALINIEAPAKMSHYALAQKIRHVTQPTLDYYVNHNASSNQFARWRKQAANQRTQQSGDYTQLDAMPDRVTGKDSKQQLIQRVRGFLKQNTLQVNQQKTLPKVKKGLFYESPVNH